MNLDSRNPREVPKTPRHNLQAVKDGCRGDLQIRISEGSASNGKPRLDLTKDARRCHVVRKNGHGGQDELFDILQVPLVVGRPEGSFVKLTDDDSARELICARHLRKPAEIRGSGSRPQDLRNRVRVEEIRHPRSVEPGRSPGPGSFQAAHGANHFLRALPPSGNAGQPLLRSGRAESLELLELGRRHQCRNRLPVARDQNRITPFG